jgi:hypothetical protein
MNMYVERQYNAGSKMRSLDAKAPGRENLSERWPGECNSSPTPSGVLRGFCSPVGWRLRSFSWILKEGWCPWTFTIPVHRKTREVLASFPMLTILGTLNWFNATISNDLFQVDTNGPQVQQWFERGLALLWRP